MKCDSFSPYYIILPKPFVYLISQGKFEKFFKRQLKKLYSLNSFAVPSCFLLSNCCSCVRKQYSFLFSKGPLYPFKNIKNMGNQNKTQTTPFQNLKELPTSLSQSQCVLHKHEILICGGRDKNDCYSYHILKNEYKFICSYSSDVELAGHCVVKLIGNNNNKDSNVITLLSFGGDKYTKRHAFVMKYVSVWGNDDDDGDNEMNKSKKEKKSKKYNRWITFTDNYKNPILIGRDDDSYSGARAVIGGSDNHLLFITYRINNISVFNLNTFQFIKHDTLPTSIFDSIRHHCFVLKSENGQEMTKTSEKNRDKKKKNNEMLLFCQKTGSSIEYDEDDNTFQFHKLFVCKDIEPFRHYAYVCVNDVILFFGGWDGELDNESVISKSVYKYLIQENKWITFQNILPSPLSFCTAILSEDSMYVHIIGGLNDKRASVLTHMKTKVNEWSSKEEMKKIELKAEEEKNINGETKKIVKKEGVKKKEEKRKWTKWWKERNEKDKEEIISKFEQLSNNDFETWLLRQSKWKHDLNNENIVAIYAAIESYIDYHSDDDIMSKEEQTKEDHNEENKEEVDNLLYIFCFLFLIQITIIKIQNMDEREKLIKMKELTFEELLRQCYNCLDSKHFQKINNENLKLQLIDIKNNIIESDEAMKKEFESNEPTFKITWISFQQPAALGKIKTIKNPLVILIAISEYDDNNTWKNLKNVKEKDINNFKQLFEQELNYEVVFNPSPRMAKGDFQDFMDRIILNFELRKNTKKYDGLVLIICGHGENGNMLVASDGKYISIDKIRSLFNCHEMESFKDFPKVFIIDTCRGESIPKTYEIVKRGTETSYGHNDDGFLIVWSTTKGHQVADLSLLSECMKTVVMQKYKSACPFKQMLQDIRTEIRNNKSSEWYCVESQDTTDYDIIFQQRKLV
ncbi:hypothetical protein RFI_04124 [Reticulomyxa filosa]|uniref:Caspase family p20 domain-containing protein n=1 Tax=Reticulomyxa filosa TaxID=46433 RepID=X6P4D1_RETFI|nr:hypothetical protein RFI_04124 [Reticulomyxa filosa]|eukprot:ETO32983.1 hypothetical protein RFI_04124 [Reticulomyxa filosa]